MIYTHWWLSAKRRNSSALAMELCLPYTNPSIFGIHHSLPPLSNKGMLLQHQPWEKITAAVDSFSNKGIGKFNIVYYSTLKMIKHRPDLNSKETTISSLIARFMGPTWGPPGADRTLVGPMLAPWTLLSGLLLWVISGAILVFPQKKRLL